MTSIVYALWAIGLYLVALFTFTYRLYICPIAYFPGLKLAALTGWVETWYDVVQGGQFTFKIEEWHKTYGILGRLTGPCPEVFHSLLESDLPSEEKGPGRLKDEAASVIGAAIETTKSTLALANFWLCYKPELLARLRDELQAAIPNPDIEPTLAELERLPFLTAFIKVSLRLSFGMAQRLLRVSSTPVYSSPAYTIPPNTPFGMSTYLQHTNPSIFPDPFEFLPDRWLSEGSGPHYPAQPKYLTPFAKGTRNCVGQHLAWAQLCIGLATMARTLDLKLLRGQTEVRWRWGQSSSHP